MANITEFPIPTTVLDPADYPEFVGATGAAGADGKTVLSGAVDPTTEGVDGDFYINTASNEIFGPKTEGAWGTGTSLVGPQGEQGIQGPAGDINSPDDSVATIVTLTQAEYDALDPKVADRLYLIVG